VSSDLSRLLGSVAFIAALAVGAVVGTSSIAASATGTPFAITHLDVPLFVKQNGAKGARRIFWQGHPTFPVTVHERGICPESVNCGPRDAAGWGTPPATKVFPASHNPLVSPNYYFCNGGLTSNYVIGVEDWLTDAAGHRTAPVRNFWVCKTH
jgi:hypothetical protein